MFNKFFHVTKQVITHVSFYIFFKVPADSGLMTFRFLMKSSTRFQINPELVSNELITLVCTTNSLYSGIDAGVTAKVLLTTVDGFDVDSGVISKSTCSKFR